MDDARAAVRRFIRTASWHRRLLAGGLAAAATALAIEAAAPPEPERVTVTVAAHDLAGGATLTVDDLTTARFSPGSVPSGVLDDATGRVLAGPVRAGEPLTDRSVLGPALLSGWGRGLVAAPVRIADPGAARFLEPGSRVDLLGSSVDGTGSARLLAENVPVLTREPMDVAPTEGGALVLVAVSPGQARDLAAAAVTARVSFTLGAR